MHHWLLAMRFRRPCKRRIDAAAGPRQPLRWRGHRALGEEAVLQRFCCSDALCWVKSHHATEQVQCLFFSLHCMLLRSIVSWAALCCSKSGKSDHVQKYTLPDEFEVKLVAQTGNSIRTRGKTLCRGCGAASVNGT